MTEKEIIPSTGYDHKLQKIILKVKGESILMTPDKTLEFILQLKGVWKASVESQIRQIQEEQKKAISTQDSAMERSLRNNVESMRLRYKSDQESFAEC